MSTPDALPTDIVDSSSVEAVRAQWYGLLSMLFYRAPDAQLHAQLRAAPRGAPDPELALTAAWDAVLDVARRLGTAELEAEHDALFGGVGKPDVYLFGSHYLAGFLNEKPLVELRDDLRAFGVVRAEGVIETEDHIACLLDTMQHLIIEPDSAGQGEGTAPEMGQPALHRQRRLFERHLASWADELGAALIRHPKAVFYARLAELLQVFLAIERQAFEMMEEADSLKPAKQSIDTRC